MDEQQRISIGELFNRLFKRIDDFEIKILCQLDKVVSASQLSVDVREISGFTETDTSSKPVIKSADEKEVEAPKVKLTNTFIAREEELMALDLLLLPKRWSDIVTFTLGLFDSERLDYFETARKMGYFPYEVERMYNRALKRLHKEDRRDKIKSLFFKGLMVRQRFEDKEKGNDGDNS